LAEGLGFTLVAKSLPDDSDLTPRNIREHFCRGHTRVQAEVVRQVVEAAGGDHTAVLESGVAEAIRSLAETTGVMDEGARLLATGKLKPTMADLLRSAKLLLNYELAIRQDQDLQGKLDRAFEAIDEMFLLAKNHMAPEAWSAYLKATERHPLLRYLPGPGFDLDSKGRPRK
jgi:hypothetical protein